MTTIKRYTKSQNSSSNNSGNNTAPKGSKENPYTPEEYDAIPLGEWKGGYVEGLGYVQPEIVVGGSHISDMSSDSYSDPHSEEKSQPTDQPETPGKPDNDSTGEPDNQTPGGGEGIGGDGGSGNGEDSRESGNGTTGGTSGGSGSSTGGEYGVGTGTESTNGHTFDVPPYTPIGYEGALVAAYCYDATKYSKILEDNYHYDLNAGAAIAQELGLVLEEPQCGFNCQLLVKMDGGIAVGYVLAFAGTDITQWVNVPYTTYSLNMDITTDFVQLFAGMNPQYALALANAIKLSDYCKENSIPLTFVGHSLGGGKAALASMVTGFTAITYNPAALSNETIQFLIDNHYSTDTSHILQYIVEGEPINFLQNFIGVPSQGYVIYVPTGESDLRNFITGHSIETIIKALQE